MRLYQILLLQTLIVMTMVSEAQISSRGSFYIAAVCKDGIVIGADTRGCFYLTDTSGNKKPLAYYEPIQKVYEMNQYAFACIGQIVLHDGNKWHYYYIDEFRKLGLKLPTLLDYANSFFSFIKTKYPEVYSQFVSNQIIFAAYENDHPTICIAKDEKFQFVDSWILPDDRCEFIYSKEDSCVNVAKTIEKTILQFADKSGQNDFIGGYITVLKISPDNTITWLTQKPVKEGWHDYNEFYDDYINNQVNIFFKSDEGKEIVLRTIKAHTAVRNL